MDSVNESSSLELLLQKEHELDLIVTNSLQYISKFPNSNDQLATEDAVTNPNQGIPAILPFTSLFQERCACRYNRAIILFQMGYYSDAFQLLSSIIAFIFGVPFNSNDQIESISTTPTHKFEIQSTIASDPIYIPRIIFFVDVLIRANQFKFALDTLDRLDSKSIKTDILIYHRIISLIQLGRYPDAYCHLQRLNSQSELCLAACNLYHAKTDCTKENDIGIGPPFSKAWYWNSLALYHCRKSNDTIAEHCFQNSLLYASPQDKNLIYINLALQAFEKRDVKKALHYCQTASCIISDEFKLLYIQTIICLLRTSMASNKDLLLEAKTLLRHCSNPSPYQSAFYACAVDLKSIEALENNLKTSSD